MINGKLSNCPKCRNIKCSCSKTIGRPAMTIEELLEALPSRIEIEGRTFKFRILKETEKDWNVGYNCWDIKKFTAFYKIKTGLREALEGVYNDLVSNKLI